ncbi:MAG: YceH family protein [Bacteroidota bacterium]|nr:YceH family protein [Bacteroidota bacterium]MDP3146104.1 YceH family protein [Bacteroidota bacterium]
MDPNTTLPLLNSIEIRVLGALIEKSKTTPDYYPMTLNALTAACNQKTSRKPVVDYDEETVVMALNSLKSQSLVSTAVGGSIRSVKYKHNFTTVYPLSDGELAVMCLLFLRGPQTPGEINTNSARLHEFRSLESVHEALNKLMNLENPFVKEIQKRAGQKETRFTHLLGEEIIFDDEPEREEPARKHVSEIESRLANVEKELAEVKESLAKIMKELF